MSRCNSKDYNIQLPHRILRTGDLDARKYQKPCLAYNVKSHRNGLVFTHFNGSWDFVI